MTLSVSRVKISNILGVEDLELTPGKFTAIVGRNGSGKTSTLEAIKAALRGGHDATLLRNGADQGEVVLVLDDGTQIGKRITPKASTAVFVGADGKRASKPAESIRELIDALSVNPIEFLAVPRKQQISALLEAMPMKADLDRLASISGMTLDASLADLHALEVIDRVHRDLYDERTGTNRAHKEKVATINQLSAAIPAGAGTVEGGEAGVLEKMAEIDRARDAELDRIDKKLAGLETTWEEKLADIDARMQALRDEQAAVLSERANIRQAAEKQRAKAGADHSAARAPLAEKLAIIQANRDAEAKARATRETIAQMEEEADALRDDADKATAALAALDAYKAELLASLPIPGLSVRDGEIYFRDVLFDRLNSAEQVKVAVEVAKLRAGQLGLVCVDGIERLDGPAFEDFKAAAMESGLQLVVTRVADGEFNVETE